MNLGKWDSALFKSLFISSLIIPVIYLFGANEIQASYLFGFLVTFLLYFGVFLLISLLGWLLIGFPTHWFICRFTSKAYFYYALIPGLFLGISYFSKGPWFLGGIALAQALLFRYFVFKMKT
ncbi:hypothetical protein EMM73_14865 [Rheinheimera sediminis]|uniref:hypothetical protein n=1 Tax=Rheinheimera sp. YQF-1 TaxID=2499626 RepID=UPI000FD8A1DE|nr:hypothetical protein [Rheinheimera sp. YQF-1]RVT44999.1 hypothetical protein EMM73_14865 [Rheinheimera sp. YQF-1]